MFLAPPGRAARGVCCDCFEVAAGCVAEAAVEAERAAIAALVEFQISNVGYGDLREVLCDLAAKVRAGTYPREGRP
jgi:hypothetical protein